MPSFDAMTEQVKPMLPNETPKSPTVEEQTDIDSEHFQEYPSEEDPKGTDRPNAELLEQSPDQLLPMEHAIPMLPEIADSADVPIADDHPLDIHEEVLQERSKSKKNELIDLLKNQTGLLMKMDKRIEQIEKQFETSTNTSELMRLSQGIEALSDAIAKQEKANIAVLRDSKNYQAGVRENMQRELDGYRKMHSETYLAPLLTEISQLYITVRQIISHIHDDKLKEDMNDMVLDTIAEILEDKGVEIHETAVGCNRSNRLCKTRKLVPTGNRELEGKVAYSLNPSFSLGNYVMIKENIDTYIYDATLDESMTPPDKTDIADADKTSAIQQMLGIDADPDQEQSEQSMQGTTPDVDQ